MNTRIKYRFIVTTVVFLVAAWLSLGNRGATTEAAQSTSTQRSHSVQVLLPYSGNGEKNCAFQTLSGYYLSAVDGGGRTTDVIHTNVRRVLSWELFDLVEAPY